MKMKFSAKKWHDQTDISKKKKKSLCHQDREVKDTAKKLSSGTECLRVGSRPPRTSVGRKNSQRSSQDEDSQVYKTGSTKKFPKRPY